MATMAVGACTIGATLLTGCGLLASPDETAPEWGATMLRTRSATATAIDLNWSPGAADDQALAGYRVLRDGSEVATVATAGHRIVGLEPDAVHRFSIIAVDHAGNESAALGPIEITTPEPGDFTLSPYGWEGRLDFEVDSLPSAEAEAAYLSWRAGIDDHARWWPHPPSTVFAPLDATDNSHGTYSYGRAGAFWIGTLVDALRTTGDGAIVDELLVWSEQLKANLADHDGRGYEYFQYEAPRASVTPEHRLTDTNLLDEQLLAGNIARLGWALHQNRHLVDGAGPAADFWFDYLDRNWVPKWRIRVTQQAGDPYEAPGELGLANAVGWTSPHTAEHDDERFGWAGPANFDDVSGVRHRLPVRDLMHPYIASIYQYEVMARYFAETERPSVGGALTYGEEARARTDYWLAKTSIDEFGTRRIPHLLRRQEASSDADTYAHHLALYANDLHWLGVPGFDTDADMAAYARIFHNPDAPDGGVYQRGDTETMAELIDGSGTNPFLMLFSSLWARWDTTGVLAELNAAAIADDRDHLILGRQGRHHGAHYNGILSAELQPPPSG